MFTTTTPPGWLLLVPAALTLTCLLFPAMQHTQLIRSDDDSGTSTDVLDVFSYDATDKSLDSTSEPDCTNDLEIILAMT